jgi:hypothetical protein
MYRFLGRTILAGVLFLGVAAAQSLQVGEYRGTAANGNVNGKATFDVLSCDASGHVRAFFSASDGLQGDGTLTGTVDANGRIQLSGQLSGWQMQVSGDLSGNELRAKYELTGQGSPQHGTFDVRYSGPVRSGAAGAKSIADLAGTWKKADAFVPMLNPITHQPQGASFQDGGTLQIDSNGKFSYEHVHNHCDSFGAKCCRLDQEHWNGSADLEGPVLNFHVASGEQLHHDSCMPAMNKQWQLSAHTESFRWEIKSSALQGGKTAPALCWKLQSDWTCYTKE